VQHPASDGWAPGRAIVRVMAELDYAFIAEFAKFENGKLTAVGASYIDVRPPVLPAPHTLSVAGELGRRKIPKPSD